MRSSPGDAALGLAQRAFGVLFCLLAAGILVAPVPSTIGYDRLLASAACLAAVAAARWGLPRLPEPRRPRRAVGLTIAAATLLAGASGLASTYPPAVWDADIVRAIAQEGSGPWVGYASRYPNNLAVVALAQGVNAAFPGAYAAGWVLVNTLAFAVAALALADVARRASARAAQAAVLVLWALLGLSPWLAVGYVDAVSAWAPIAAIALALRADAARGRRALALSAGAGAAAAAGFVLRTTPLLTLVALAVWVAARGFGGPGTSDAGAGRWAGARRAGASLLALAVAAGAVVLGGRAALERVADYPARPGYVVTGLLNVAMGLSYAPESGVAGSYGSYDPALDTGTFDLGAAEQNAIARDYIDRRLAELGPLGTASFYAHKTLFTWGDGMFFAYGEGGDAASAPDHAADAGAPWVWVNHPSGGAFYARTALADGLWFAVLLLAGWSALRGPLRRDLALLALNLLGLWAFQLAFQTRSRYLLTYLPVAIAAAAAGARGVRAGGTRPAGR